MLNNATVACHVSQDAEYSRRMNGVSRHQSQVLSRYQNNLNYEIASNAQPSGTDILSRFFQSHYKVINHDYHSLTTALLQ